MKVLLARHAQPKPKEQEDDPTLSEIGWSQIRKTAAFAAQHADSAIQTILHSGKARARQTAEVLGQLLKPNDDVRESDGLKPMDSPEIWAKRLSRQNNNIALVGHLPHMAKLAALLLCKSSSDPMIEFTPATIVCLNRDDKGAWSLEWMVNPDMLDK
jgi:phosphohistidine phosphatase